MKTTLQLSIDTDLKQRLMNLSEQSGKSASRYISDLLREYLPEEEKRNNIQLSLEEATLAPPIKRIGKRAR